MQNSILFLFMSMFGSVSLATAFELNSLRFSNRAQCAIDSQKPTQSLFLILDGYNAGKVANTVARNFGVDAKEKISEAMRDFRLTTTHMTLDIMKRLLDGELPLLPADIQIAQRTLPNYYEVVRQCRDQVYCPELANYISKIFHLSEMGMSLPEWKKLDSFETQNFISAPGTKQIGCYYLNKFSPLQGHLHNPILNEKILDDLAVAALEKNQLISNCYNSDVSLNSRQAAIQIDLDFGNQKLWEKVGFDFWNSVRIYLSWAWRNTDTPVEMSRSWGQLFKSIDLEDSMMMLSNGCQSLSSPKCDNEYLSTASLREFAKQKPEAGQNRLVPNGAHNDLLDRGVRSVNDDFLGTQYSATASDWVSEFRKNYVASRGGVKLRAQKSNDFMQMIKQNMSPQELGSYVQDLIQRPDRSVADTNEMWALCVEMLLTYDKDTNFMKDDIESLANLDVLKKLFGQENLSDSIAYFKEFAQALKPSCDALRTDQNLTKEDFSLNRNYLKPWAQEMIQHKPTADAVVPVVYGAPLLSWQDEDSFFKDSGKLQKQVICQTAYDCAHLVFTSMVDFLALSHYADSMLTTRAQVKAIDAFNPYAEITACKMYDPWFQTKRNQKKFAIDLANAVLFSFFPIYLDVDFKMPKVTSIKKLISDGSLKFDPQVSKSKPDFSLFADLSSLVDAPCAISIAQNDKEVFNFYSFTGITVNRCSNGAKKLTTTVQDANDIKNKTTQGNTVCGSCTLQFVGSHLTQAHVKTFAPVNLLFRAVYRFFQSSKDDVNIPRLSEVNIKHAIKAHLDYGKIPKVCVEELGQGLKCYQDICASTTARYIEEKFNTEVHSVQIQNRFDENDTLYKKAWIKSDLCEGEISVTVSCRSKAKNFWLNENSFAGFDGNCKSKAKEMRK